MYGYIVLEESFLSSPFTYIVFFCKLDKNFTTRVTLFDSFQDT